MTLLLRLLIALLLVHSVMSHVTSLLRDSVTHMLIDSVTNLE